MDPAPRSGFRKQKEHQGARRCPLPPPLFETELRNDDASRDDGPPQRRVRRESAAPRPTVDLPEETGERRPAPMMDGAERL
mmetsp:Transcript_30499/g.91058  ORF Transcript_30499/g.91058 Transcript_30499/m.91058 type:complete len:81 (-) Transcript_30499:646-888(-)